jgi:hypothetical protein
MTFDPETAQKIQKLGHTQADRAPPPSTRQQAASRLLKLEFLPQSALDQILYSARPSTHTIEKKLEHCAVLILIQGNALIRNLPVTQQSELYASSAPSHGQGRSGTVTPILAGSLPRYAYVLKRVVLSLFRKDAKFRKVFSDAVILGSTDDHNVFVLVRELRSRLLSSDTDASESLAILFPAFLSSTATDDLHAPLGNPRAYFACDEDNESDGELDNGTLDDEDLMEMDASGAEGDSGDEEDTYGTMPSAQMLPITGLSSVSAALVFNLNCVKVLAQNYTNGTFSSFCLDLKRAPVPHEVGLYLYEFRRMSDQHLQEKHSLLTMVDPDTGLPMWKDSTGQWYRVDDFNRASLETKQGIARTFDEFWVDLDEMDSTREFLRQLLFHDVREEDFKIQTWNNTFHVSGDGFESIRDAIVAAIDAGQDPVRFRNSLRVHVRYFSDLFPQFD